MRYRQELSNEYGGTLVESATLVGLIGVLCIVAVTGFGSSVGKFYCDLSSNTPTEVNEKRKGLSFTTTEQDIYYWDDETHQCVSIHESGNGPGSFGGFGGGSFG